MTQPTPYRRGYDFSDAGGAQPPGGPLDDELDDVGLTLSQILRNMALLQRDDTGLRNGIVGIDALDGRVLGLISGGTFSIAGTWATGTPYPAGAFLTDDGAIYLVMEAHTSTSIVDDLAAGRIAKALQNEQGTRLRDDFVGNAVQTEFSLSQSPARPTDVEVYVDGALVLPDDYVQTGATVTFDVAPANGAKISVFSITWATAPPIQTLVDAVGDRNIEISAATQFLADVGDGAPGKGASLIATEGIGDVQSDLDARPTTAALASSSGGDMVGLTFPGGGGVVRSSTEKAFDELHAKDFGAVGDGIADDTEPLQKLLAAMQATGRPGRLGGAGEDTRYLVTPGALVWTFDNSVTVDSPGPAGPDLRTSGKVTLVSDGTVDAPLLSIHNDPDHGFRFIHGGYVGALSFEDKSVGGSATRRHGLLLYGVNSMHFGVMTATNGLRGDVIFLERHGDALTGDGWHVFDCTFEGAVIWGSQHYAFNADSVTQVFNLSKIRTLWALGAAGAFKGAGAGLHFEQVSTQYCSGVAFDWKPTEGTVQRLRVDAMELDACFKSIRLEGIQHATFGIVRHIYRKDASTGNVTWPTRSVELVTDGGTIITNLSMTNHHRFGIPTDGDLPSVMVDWGGSANMNSISIDHFYSLPGGFGSLTMSRLLGNLSNNSAEVTSKANGASILAHREYSRCAVIARVSTAAGQVQASSYDGSNPITFASEQVDPVGCFSGTTFTAPAKGLYFLRARMLYQPGADSLCRLGLFINATTIPFRETYQHTPDGMANGQSWPVEVSCIYPLARGDTVKVCMQEAFARDLLAGTAGLLANNYFEAYLL